MCTGSAVFFGYAVGHTYIHEARWREAIFTPLHPPGSVVHSPDLRRFVHPIGFVWAHCPLQATPFRTTADVLEKTRTHFAGNGFSVAAAF